MIALQRKYKGVTYHIAEVLVLVVVAAFAASAVVYARSEKNKLADQIVRHTNALKTANDATREIRELQKVTPEVVAEIQARQHSVETRLLTSDQWEAFVKELGDAWVFNSGQRTDHSTHVALHGELTFLHQSVAEAQAILDTLKKTEDLSPMLGIDRLTIVTDGDATSRRFTAVKVAVTVPLRPSK